jgi:hypothetical protein
MLKAGSGNETKALTSAGVVARVAENDSRPRRDFLRPRALSKVLIALLAPTIVFALLGGHLGTLLLYVVIVVDGIALALLALSRFDSSVGRIMTERNNDSVRYYHSLAGGRVLSVAIEVNLAARSSSLFSTSARRNLAAILSEILPLSPSRAASSGTGAAGIRRTDLESQVASDLRVLLSYNQKNQPPKGDAKDPSAKIGRGLPTIRILSGISGRLRGQPDLDYLARLERVVTMLEEEDSKITTPFPKHIQQPVGDSPSP